MDLKEKIITEVKKIYDPEIPVNIVDLGLVYDCTVSEEKDGVSVSIKMTLTAPGCGMGPYIAQQAEWAISEIEDLEDVTVEVVFEPPWSPDMLTEDGKALLGI